MNVQEIEAAITKLAPKDLAELAAWFEEYQGQAWDEQIARDVRAGRFEPLIRHAQAQSALAGNANRLSGLNRPAAGAEA